MCFALGQFTLSQDTNFQYSSMRYAGVVVLLSALLLPGAACMDKAAIGSRPVKVKYLSVYVMDYMRDNRRKVFKASKNLVSKHGGVQLLDQDCGALVQHNQRDISQMGTLVKSTQVSGSAECLRTVKFYALIWELAQEIVCLREVASRNKYSKEKLQEYIDDLKLKLDAHLPQSLGEGHLSVIEVYIQLLDQSPDFKKEFPWTLIIVSVVALLLVLVGVAIFLVFMLK